MTAHQDVLDFWFGAAGTPQHGRRRSEWFRKSDAFDAEIRARFLPLYESAVSGDLDAWRDAPESLLALIVVLDQFPRNMFRNDARAFAADAQALDCALCMADAGWDGKLAPLERWFAYLPLEHAEDMAMQERALERFGDLARDEAYADTLDWARRHHAVIARFGRFPHRNELLGRASTAEEIAFLAQPGSRF